MRRSAYLAATALEIMRILKVIHGYPMRYNSGYGVYTQGLCQALAERREVHVFTRQENAFLPEYAIQRATDPGVVLHVIDMARARDGYSHRAVDEAFAALLGEIEPDAVHVHVGYLNHLSTSLLFPAKARDVPVVFTLHDYWLMCPGGSSSKCMRTSVGSPSRCATTGRTASTRCTATAARPELTRVDIDRWMAEYAPE